MYGDLLYWLDKDTYVHIASLEFILNQFSYNLFWDSLDKTAVTAVFYNHTPSADGQVLTANGNSAMFTISLRPNYDK